MTKCRKGFVQELIDTLKSHELQEKFDRCAIASLEEWSKLVCHLANMEDVISDMKQPAATHKAVVNKQGECQHTQHLSGYLTLTRIRYLPEEEEGRRKDRHTMERKPFVTSSGHHRPSFPSRTR